MIALWPWALLVLLVPVLGGGFLSLGAARPDLPLAFIGAAAARRDSLVALVPPCAALCAARHALCPPDGRTEALVFTLAAAALIGLHRLVRIDGRGAVPLLTGAAFVVLIAGTALLQRSTGGSVTLPALPVMAGALVYTTAAAAVFAALLPAPRSES
ncbi:MAG TPA: hypothetical protein PKX48_12385 [Planctomycetota bacterium]|jgi:hypothetical protein|nr:hypothetical protein [Planctomycetota bacterium]OQC22181.1 MAG: hypothetical protein BWX69_00032 [Planctomycetes bacterium ADurb.Bin069]HNR99745.1 hypothetical protein [Planctomycetota bacterium]HNU25364.1 hypothetical protein [Planctomycetota bacterium]HOE29367.1 hypothetical protein [Planctomycetota bacterium]